MKSIRRRLLLWLLLPLTLAALLADAVTFFKARTELLETLDRELEAAAHAAFEAPSLAGAPAPRKRLVRIAGEATTATPADSGPPIAESSGPSTLFWQGEAWRAYVVSGNGRVVQAAEPLATHRSYANATALEIIAPFSVAAVPLFALLIWFGVGRGLAPLTELAQALERRRPGRLDPIDEKRLPREVLPLVHALNDLLDRLADLIGKERRFMGDAAHGLRTPLAAVQLQLENLELAKTPAERTEAIGRLKSGVYRATHLVAQMLTTARLAAHDDGGPHFVAVELEALVKRVLVDYQPHAEHRGIDLGLVASESLVADGDAESLRILLSNLVDNALRYTMSGGVVDVALRRDGHDAVVEIVDDGPGIPREDRQRVFDRFYRRENEGVPGSGLGLAIVSQVVAQHRGQVSLGEGPAGRGVRATVRLPLRAAATFDRDRPPDGARQGDLHAAT